MLSCWQYEIFKACIESMTYDAKDHFFLWILYIWYMHAGNNNMDITKACSVI